MDTATHAFRTSEVFAVAHKKLEFMGLFQQSEATGLAERSNLKAHIYTIKYREARQTNRFAEVPRLGSLARDDREREQLRKFGGATLSRRPSCRSHILNRHTTS